MMIILSVILLLILLCINYKEPFITFGISQKSYMYEPDETDYPLPAPWRRWST